MLKTRITEMLGIEKPILVGGLQWLATPEFVASVSEAGGIGFLTAAAYPDKESFRADIRKAKSLTNKPIGCNISMLPELIPMELTMQHVQVVIEEGITVVESSGNKPAPIVEPLKAAGVKVLHKVTAPKHAVSAVKAGVDGIVIVGYESAGHPGMNEVGTMVTLPATLDEVDVPVVCSGGVCDGASMAGALTMGADGVMLGTRVVATDECPCHENFKKWIVNAEMTDTVITERTVRNAGRMVKNDRALAVLGLEAAGCQMKDIMPYIDTNASKKAMYTGDLQAGMLTAGQCCGRIHDIVPMKVLFDRMTEDAEKYIRNMYSKLV